MLPKNPYPNDAGLTSDDFDGIVERYRGMLSAIGHQFRLTPEEREDATQSTWLQLFRNIEHIRNLDCVGGWLATTMRRQCISASRRWYVENPMSDLPESPADPAASDRGGDRPGGYQNAIFTGRRSHHNRRCYLRIVTDVSEDSVRGNGLMS